MSLRNNEEDPDTQVVEEFWGVELTKEKKNAKWNVDEDDEEEMFTSYALELRQACLGVGAKEGERNVVQVTVDGDERGETSHVICSLRFGNTEQCSLFLNFQPPVTFKLVEGSGPVHILGQTTETMTNLSMDSDDDDESEEEEVEKEVVKTINPKKRASTSNVSKPAKMVKKESDDQMDGSFGKEDSDDEDDDDYDEDDDEEEEEEKQLKTKTQIGGKSNGKPEATSKGTPRQKQNASKTPQPQKSGKWQQKGSMSEPKVHGDKKKHGKATDIDEIKQRLTKMNVPKKLDKFKNFVGNSFKVKDEEVKKQLWEFVQKNLAQK